MKRFYSTILLFSFCVGTLQPILPMAEFYLYKGDLLELIQLQVNSQKNHTNDAFCTHDLTTLADDWQNNKDENTPLIDMEYYPIPIQVSTDETPAMLPIAYKEYVGYHQNLLAVYINLITPPPRLG